MKTFGFAALAAVAALILGFGANLGTSTPRAQASATGSVAIGCEFLASAIDGNLDNATVAADYTNACDGISAAEIINLAKVLGDADGGKLEASDFTDIDLDANQVQTTGTMNSTVIFVFVNNEGPVTVDAGTGLAIVGVKDTGGTGWTNTPANNEICSLNTDDADCSNSATNDGDGVVVAIASVPATGGAAAGATVDITSWQNPSSGDTSVQTINVTGTPHDVTLAAVKGTFETSASSTAFTACKNALDVKDATAQIGETDKGLVAATVLDTDGTALTRAVVTFSTGAATKANFDADDSTEIASDPKSTTGESVDVPAGKPASYALLCGGTSTGTATITASVVIGTGLTDTSSVDVTVVGPPASIALTAAPAQIACDGTQTSTVTAKVTDSAGNNVADGTSVTFSVVALGTANPITAKTTAGMATSTVTPLSGSTAGTTVVVSAGDASSSIRVDCSLPVPTPTATGGTAPVATPTRTGTIGGPDTGNGGFVAQDGSAGFPMWTLVALALGSVALVGGGLVTRRSGK